MLRFDAAAFRLMFDYSSPLMSRAFRHVFAATCLLLLDAIVFVTPCCRVMPRYEKGRRHGEWHQHHQNTNDTMSFRFFATHNRLFADDIAAAAATLIFAVGSSSTFRHAYL